MSRTFGQTLFALSAAILLASTAHGAWFRGIGSLEDPALGASGSRPFGIAHDGSAAVGMGSFPLPSGNFGLDA